MYASFRRARISVRGVVQGVGFRPFVYQIAAEHRLNGWVRNTSGEVEIEVEGEETALARFLGDLETKAPTMARIEAISHDCLPPEGYTSFEIRESQAYQEKYQLVSPDIATCDACRREIFTPADRRFRYPFTNCTNCGPRFTIIEDIPYDRPRTTMRTFKMCPDCQREYEDPLDRRFHAQPNACPVCGPSLELVDSREGPVPCPDVVREACKLLKEGKIVAVKGLGGFLLACDATNEDAVRTLRARKHRPFKPLAVMMATVDEVKQHCEVSAAEEKLLLAPASPIVLLRRKKATSSVTERVSPGLGTLGVMAPYTPLHHLLLQEAGVPLVMTSGNLSEEPIARDNDEALRRLGGIADYFLMHNREIYARYDDSVFVVEGGLPRPIRRARGYAPYPVRLPYQSRQVLACGAELKNTFCLTRDDHAFISQHIGDLENEETLEHFETTIELYEKLFRISPAILAYDMHPEYLSTKYAQRLLSEDQPLTSVAVQHHHAHIASCLAENGFEGPAIGVALDGVGYGPDGTIWGGEFLIADWRGFERVGHLEQVPLPGGAAAILRPYRMATSYVLTLLGEKALSDDLPIWQDLSAPELEVLKQQIRREINAPLTSSCGRLFDAVAALVGIRGTVEYEAQAAIELEMAAGEPDTSDLSDLSDASDCYPFAIKVVDGVRIVRLGDLLEAVISDVKTGASAPLISARFHATMARLIVQMCHTISKNCGLNTVALSGGCFQNRLLFRLTTDALVREGFTVLTHKLVPCNDGGVSLGQAVIANFAAGQ
ncbi:MAG: carbamoyltransferase HypF [Chloroflexi bacterium]|nr:carbamoyltransferase HypF [Chloroflexota bacterium]